ncbi:unnamed protein product [Cuscuta campestris]|uniref:Uncharacterized protein n=1 Tax=Cuscuta campestris TaxID=132261 RepID=A0A484L9P9_9ASTE|nr:unnamed protein product [Cuscuta campestris]
MPPSDGKIFPSMGGVSSSTQPTSSLGFHPQGSGTHPIGRATGSLGSLEPSHVQVDGFGLHCSQSLPGTFPPPLAVEGMTSLLSSFHQLLSTSQNQRRRASLDCPLARMLLSIDWTFSGPSRRLESLPGPPASGGPQSVQRSSLMPIPDNAFGDLPHPYAREAHLFTGYTAWAGEDFQCSLYEMDQFRKDHPDVVESPAWPFMLDEYTRMSEYVTTSATQRNALRLLDRNAALSRESGDF